MKIAVCDDEKAILSLIDSYFRRPEWKEKKLEIDYFSHENQLLETWKQKSYDLLIIDIQLNTMNGLEVVKYGRNKGLEPYVIYVSAYDEYALAAYDTQAYHYLVKPVSYERFFQVVERVCQIYARDHQIYTAVRGHERIALNIGDICYFDSYGRITHVHTVDHQYQISATLDHEEENLPNQFIRIHQGYIVNLQYVRKIKSHTVIMSNGQELEISVRKKRMVWEKFTDYVTKHEF